MSRTGGSEGVAKLLFRAGLLSLILMFSVQDLLTSVRVTADVMAWHALPMWIVYGTVAAVARWGFRAAVAGQPLFRDEIQEVWTGAR